jgi:hypothetical protein
MSCIAEVMTTLATEKAAAENRYRELVQAVARGTSPTADDLVTLATTGKSLDAFQTDCEDAGAAEADQAARREAIRLQGNEQRTARETLARVNNELAIVEVIGGRVVTSIAEATRSVRDKWQEYLGQTFAEARVLQGQPNRWGLEGHRKFVRDLAAEIENAWKCLPHRDNADFSGQKAHIQSEERRLEAAKAAATEWKVKADLPKAPEAADVFQTGIAAGITTLLGCAPHLFWMVAAAFQQICEERTREEKVLAEGKKELDARLANCDRLLASIDAREAARANKP